MEHSGVERANKNLRYAQLMKYSEGAALSTFDKLSDLLSNVTSLQRLHVSPLSAAGKVWWNSDLCSELLNINADYKSTKLSYNPFERMETDR